MSVVCRKALWNCRPKGYASFTEVKTSAIIVLGHIIDILKNSNDQLHLQINYPISHAVKWVVLSNDQTMSLSAGTDVWLSSEVTLYGGTSLAWKSPCPPSYIQPTAALCWRDQGATGSCTPIINSTLERTEESHNCVVSMSWLRWLWRMTWRVLFFFYIYFLLPTEIQYICCGQTLSYVCAGKIEDVCVCRTWLLFCKLISVTSEPLLSLVFISRQ